jgi:hypothetical protein
MRWTSLAEISANLDPHYRAQIQKQQMQLYIAQGQAEQSERHHNAMMNLHYDKMNNERERAQIEAHASIEREIITGKNAIALADRNHILGQLAQSSTLIDDMVRSQLKQEEDWNAAFADTMRQLFVQEGDTVRQTKLKELEFKHAIETKVFEFNCKIIEKFVDSELADYRLVFEKSCEVIFKLIERALGFGDEMMSEADINELVREWVERDNFC